MTTLCLFILILTFYVFLGEDSQDAILTEGLSTEEFEKVWMFEVLSLDINS